ncbi:unnamed protein product, partial [Hapterophycus canaliculatus]
MRHDYVQTEGNTIVFRLERNLIPDDHVFYCRAALVNLASRREHVDGTSVVSGEFSSLLSWSLEAYMARLSRKVQAPTARLEKLLRCWTRTRSLTLVVAAQSL